MLPDPLGDLPLAVERHRVQLGHFLVVICDPERAGGVLGLGTVLGPGNRDDPLGDDPGQGHLAGVWPPCVVPMPRNTPTTFSTVSMG